MRRTIFATAIAVAAALLFVVQPMIARLLLPIVGGSTLVWSTALVFFQLSLLGGYSLAHLLSKGGGWQRVALPAALAVAGALTLPFVAPESSVDWSAPGAWVLMALATMVGVPFVVLSATSPLLQRWYSTTDAPDAHEPYRLYAASNAGSIVGLLSYPFLIEPLATLQTQAIGWAVGFAVLVFLVAATGAQTPSFSAAREAAPTRPPERSRQLWWVVCSAIPSSLLVTITANITADIAPVPLLWVVPLTVYLGSHVWVFSRVAPSTTRSLGTLVAVIVPYTAFQFFDLSKPWWFFAPLAVIALGIVAVAYHGELVRTRPAPEHLTTFYLWTAVGGVLGGAFATFGGPVLFDTLFELRLELVAAMLVLPIAREAKPSRSLVAASLVFTLVVVAANTSGGSTIILTLVACVVIANAYDRRLGFAAIVVIGITTAFMADPIMTARSPYGRYRIDKIENDLGEFRVLIVGRVEHGTQARNEAIRDLPLSYYHPSGPLGQVLRDPVGDGPIGAIGLGIGAAATYARADRPVTFFEIDPMVAAIARNRSYFSHLAKCGENCSVVVGDGRLRVEEIPDGSLAVLVVDAFAGDAIPTHLLTVEAFEIYKRKLRPSGAVLVNGSNMFVDITTVVANTAGATGLQAVGQSFWPREAHLRELQVPASDWVLLSADTAVIDRFAADPRWKRVAGHADDAWTDDWQNLFAHYIWN